MINPYIVNIVGLGFDIAGAFLIAYYIMKGGNVDFIQHSKIFKGWTKNKSDTENPFKKSERWLVTFGFVFLIIGFGFQVYSNWLQYNA